MNEYVLEPYLQKALDMAHVALEKENLDDLLSDFLNFERSADSNPSHKVKGMFGSMGDQVAAVKDWLDNVDLDQFSSEFESIVRECESMSSVFFEDREHDASEILLNNALKEYCRTTEFHYPIWDHSEYEFCIHLQEEFGISVKLVTDATWEAECCHWGQGCGGTVLEAVFNCFLDYSNDVKNGGDK